MRVAVLAPKRDLPLKHLRAATSVQVCRTTKDFEAEFGRAEMAVMDLRDGAAHSPVALTERLLSEHPFVKVVGVIGTSGISLEESFQLGKLGLYKIMTTKEVEDPKAWQQLGVEMQTASLVERFRWSLRRTLREQMTPLMGVFLSHFTAPAVKQLVHRVPISHARTPEGRRRALWRQCQAEGLASPEDVLFGVRLLFIKAAVDDGQWSHDQIAAYLEYPCAQAMWRSIRRRSGYTVTHLRTTPAFRLYADTAARFLQRRGG